MPIPGPSFTHYQKVSRAKESRSWLPKFVRASVRPWQVWQSVGPTGESRGRKGWEHCGFSWGAVLRSRSCILSSGSAADWQRNTSLSITFGWWRLVVESCHLTVVMSEVSRLPQSVLARADKFWVSSW